MRAFVIIAALIVLATGKPIDIDEDHADLSAANEPSADGHHFGDRLNPYAPTTPRDAGNVYSLSYIQNNFPEQPQQDDPEAPAKARRSLEEDIGTNKQFFDNVRKAELTNQSTDATVAAPIPTIAINDLLHAVESTLFHSAQNLAIANATNSTSFVSTETSTFIALPIQLPTPAPANSTDDNKEVANVTAECGGSKRSDHNNDYDGVSAPEVESIKQLAGSNLSLALLAPIEFHAPHPDADNVLLERIETTEDDEDTAATTTSEALTDAANITIIQTINSTQIIATDTGHRVQQQHITLFSAADGIFPLLPSVPLGHHEVSAKQSSGSSDSSSSDSESEESKESTANCDSSSSQSVESSGEESKCLEKLVSPHTDASTKITSTTETEAVEILKEKIAEVAADPVILTQGI